MLNYEDRADRSSSPLKRRRIDATTSQTTVYPSIKNNQITRWRSSSEQTTYSSKLVEALRQVRRRNPPTVSGSRAVRDAADKALAIAAKGRTRWSRAILTNRLKLRLRSHKKAKKATAKIPPRKDKLKLPVTGTGSCLLSGERKAPGLEKRVKVLGRLVPGCQKLSFPNLLEEATDYIAALQMQVRTMAALAQLLSGSTSSTAGPMDIGPSSHSIDNHNDIIDNDSDDDNTPVH